MGDIRRKQQIPLRFTVYPVLFSLANRERSCYTDFILEKDRFFIIMKTSQSGLTAEGRIHMKHRFLLWAAAAVYALNLCSCASKNCGEHLKWTLDRNGTLTVSGTGDMTDWGLFCDTVPWESKTSEIQKAVISDGVTHIGNFAFSASALTAVSIPDSVTSIGNQAFSCCDALTAVTIPEGVTSIGDYAFYYCTGLTAVTLPDSVTSIGDSAFNNCYGLTSVTILNGITQIGKDVFSGCYRLTEVTIPDSVTHIGENAFYGCGALTAVTIPESVTHIGENAFHGCGTLTAVTIPESVTEIGKGAFSECINLGTVTVLNETCSIGGGQDETFSCERIRGCKGSTAEAYAKRFSIEFEALPEKE